MPLTILIVEDETAIADTLAYALSTDGFRPHHVTLGQQALDYLATCSTEAPALIVLDVGLPDMSGFELCRRLRQFTTTPVIFLTARNDEIDRIVGLEIGADDYVTKPFSPRELVARVRAVLRRLRPAEPTPASPMAGARATRDAANPTGAAAAAAPEPSPRFSLRADEGRILFHGQPLVLTRYEYLLLKTLLAHPGHLLSRAQLMDLVWTDAGDTQERTVDAHIKSLRAKLRQVCAGDDPIQTQRGMGYRLDPA